MAMFVFAGCGGGSTEQTPAATAPTPTPFTLGPTLSLGGKQITLPPGVSAIDQTPSCQTPESAGSPACINDLKIILKGYSYVIYDPVASQIVARAIRPEDAAEFAPIIAILTGQSVDAAPSGSPAASR